MEKAIKMKFRMKSLFMAVTLFNLLLLGVGLVQAGVTCSTNMSTTTDSDGDGFTDFKECYGFTMSDGKTKVYGRANCPGGSAICLDPDTKDLFIVMVPASGSTYLSSITNPLQDVANSVGQSGLGIRVHVVQKSQVSSLRVVTSGSTQKAAMVTESLDTSSPTVLGLTNTGTPNGLDNSTIYTQRIVNYLQGVCGPGYANCVDAYSNATGTEFLNRYILHIINHEVGHELGPLSPTYNASYGGYHYKTGSNVIMDQAVYYTTANGKNTFYIGTGYTSTDQNSIKLK
jgi:hypothetical protein